MKNENKKQKSELPKSLVFQKQYKLNSRLDFHNFKNNIQAKSYEYCPPNIKQIMTNCKTLNKHCYKSSNTSLNTFVCNWKSEVLKMITNMQKRRYNFVQNAKAHDMWKQHSFN